jgi:hypothetical protein
MMIENLDKETRETIAQALYDAADLLEADASMDDDEIDMRIASASADNLRGLASLFEEAKSAQLTLK